MSITTKRGDDGITDLMFGKRISKTSLRISLLGTLDELNAALGLARAHEVDPSREKHIIFMQEKLIALMGMAATLPEDAERYTQAGYVEISDDDVKLLEREAKLVEKNQAATKTWLRPGEDHNVSSAALHLARAIARRAERETLMMKEENDLLPAPAYIFLNRLSDFLWLLANA